MAANKLNILLVEDHVATAQALKIMLQRRGYQVRVAFNGQEAIALIRAEPCDLLISDVGLPDLDGWTLLEELRRLQPSLKAVAISGHGYASDLARSSEAGFERHLTKPVQMSAVDEVIGVLFPDISEDDISSPPKASENPTP